MLSYTDTYFCLKFILKDAVFWCRFKLRLLYNVITDYAMFCHRFTPAAVGRPTQSGPDPFPVRPVNAAAAVRGIQTSPIPSGLYTPLPASSHERKVCPKVCLNITHSMFYCIMLINPGIYCKTQLKSVYLWTLY